MPRKTSLGNILEANADDASAPPPAAPPLDATVNPSISATRRHSVSAEIASQPAAPTAAPKPEAAAPALSRSVHEALTSDSSRVTEDPGGYTIITRRTSSIGSAQIDDEQQDEVLHELDEAGYSVVRRRGSSSDGVSEMKSTTTTTTASTRRRQPKRHQSSHSPNPKGGTSRAAPSQQQQQQRQQPRRVSKKEPRHHGQQQQPWRRNSSSGASTSNTSATAASRDEADPMESPWLISPAPPAASLALPTSSSLLWTGAGAMPSAPAAAQPSAPPPVEALAQDEDPHLAWANAAKWAAAASSSDADSTAPLAPASLQVEPRSAASPSETMMSSWLGWDIAKGNPSDLDGL